MPTKLRLYDTMTRRKETFRSIVPGEATMFVCGPTIQDFMHVGHARTYLFYDMLARYLAYIGYNVRFLLNITDVDEGIVNRAKAEGIRLSSFTSKFRRSFLTDMRGLGIRSVSAYESVSKFVPVVIEQIKGLLSRGYAYPADGNIYFSIDAFPDFGKLSHLTREQIMMRPLEISRVKKNQADFSLWRATSSVEQQWESPWGRGTPGWHIQDTAVSSKHFGAQYDIHGGARELIYPHHEAEIAQMEALTGRKPFVRFWVHTGLLTQRWEKMSKSKGNVLRIKDLLKDYDPNALRLYLLRMHHTVDAEFDESEVRKWEATYWRLRDLAKATADRSAGGHQKLHPSSARFFAAMDDDMDGRSAIDFLLKVARKGARERNGREASRILQLLLTGSSILGVTLFDAEN
ncbi:MAG: cysteine--tRNA ligase [Thaumarchaeota archaeon]|nr:cysteine--tRNA ligase [Nitrososphaerota archaeon]